MACCKSFHHKDHPAADIEEHNRDDDVELQEMAGLVKVPETNFGEEDHQTCMKL